MKPTTLKEDCKKWTVEDIVDHIIFISAKREAAEIEGEDFSEQRNILIKELERRIK
jgi:hypothetical protein